MPKTTQPVRSKKSKTTKSTKKTVKKQESVEKTNPLEALLNSLNDEQKELFSEAVTLAVKQEIKSLEVKITNSILENLKLPKKTSKRGTKSTTSKEDLDEAVENARSVKDLPTKEHKELFIEKHGIEDDLPEIGDNKDGTHSSAQLTKVIREYFRNTAKEDLPLPTLPELKKIKNNKSLYHRVKNPEKKGDVKKKDELEAFIVVHDLGKELFEKYPEGGSKQNKDFTVEEYKTVVVPHLEEMLGSGKTSTLSTSGKTKVSKTAPKPVVDEKTGYLLLPLGGKDFIVDEESRSIVGKYNKTTGNVSSLLSSDRKSIARAGFELYHVKVLEQKTGEVMDVEDIKEYLKDKKEESEEESEEESSESSDESEEEKEESSESSDESEEEESSESSDESDAFEEESEKEKEEKKEEKKETSGRKKPQKKTK